jgi:uncharacterized protein (UPF0333 family)
VIKVLALLRIYLSKNHKAALILSLVVIALILSISLRVIYLAKQNTSNIDSSSVRQNAVLEVEKLDISIENEAI